MPQPIWVYSSKYHRLVPAKNEESAHNILEENERARALSFLPTPHIPADKHRHPEDLSASTLIAQGINKFDRHWKSRKDKNSKRKGHKPIHICPLTKSFEL